MSARDMFSDLGYSFLGENRSLYGKTCHDYILKGLDRDYYIRVTEPDMESYKYRIEHYGKGDWNEVPDGMTADEMLACLERVKELKVSVIDKSLRPCPFCGCEMHIKEIRIDPFIQRGEQDRTYAADGPHSLECYLRSYRSPCSTPEKAAEEWNLGFEQKED